MLQILSQTAKFGACCLYVIGYKKGKSAFNDISYSIILSLFLFRFVMSDELSCIHWPHFARSAANWMSESVTIAFELRIMRRSFLMHLGTVDMSHVKRPLWDNTNEKWTDKIQTTAAFECKLQMNTHHLDQMNAIIFHDWSLLNLQWLFIMRHSDAPIQSKWENICNCSSQT